MKTSRALRTIGFASMLISGCGPHGIPAEPEPPTPPRYRRARATRDSAHLKHLTLNPSSLSEGEPCSFAGQPYFSPDNCDVGAFCWEEDAPGDFRCAQLCSGSLQELICPEDFFCIYYWEELIVCMTAACDPVAQDCPNPDELCIPNAYFAEDWCLDDDAEAAGQIHEPCQYPTECAAGLACVETVFAAVECDPDQIACCEPYCELGVDICPGVGQECTQIYIFEDVGVCVLP